MSLEHVSLWDRCLAIIQDNVSEEIYKSWFAPIVPLSYLNDVLTLQVPSNYFIEQIEEKYLGLLQPTLLRVFGPKIQLVYNVKVIAQPTVTVDYPVAKKPVFVSKQEDSTPIADPFRQRTYEDLDPQLNPQYTFESYYPGHSNMLARTAAETIAEKPGHNPFNPFFLFGESGVGKTHLIQAIGIKIKESNPAARVLYLSSHVFQTQYTTAVRNNKVNDFISFYQSIDVLLMDDIQEFANKIHTQNTFFHIFNHLHQNNKQLVLTCDRPPVELEGMEPRLLTRFKWGLTAEVERPDYLLRRSILENKVRRDGLEIAPEVIDHIARNVTDNVRDLEGIIVSLMAHSAAFDREITIELADRVLAASVRMVKKQITLETIKEAVCGFYGMDAARLVVRSRKREIVLARQISMYLAKKYTSLSLAGIGDALGKKDHATVLHACKTIAEQIGVDKALHADMEEIEMLIQK